MNLKQLTIQERAKMPKKIHKKMRIKIGRALHAIALLPLGTSPLFLLSIPMTMAISPTVWFKGRINAYKGNGDLIL